MGWFSVYLKKRIIFIFLLGISSGFPAALLTGSVFGYWMSESGVNVKTIGLFALVGSAYSLKFLWSPLIDKINLPIFTRLLGRRKGWMLFIQLLLLAVLIALGFSDPATEISKVALLAVVAAFLSASQDIVIDAYRIEILPPDELGAGAASGIFGWRVGAQILVGVGAMYMNGFGFSWPDIYTIISLLVLLGMFVAIFGPKPEIENKITTKKTFLEWLEDAFVAPFRDFSKQKGWLVFLLFIVFFKLGDALMSGVLMGAFYKNMGFDPITLANITKWFGFAATIIGAFLGGVMVKKIGVIKTLWIGAFFQASTNLVFAALSLRGNDMELLIAAVGFDNLSGALGTTAFVAFISGLCNLQYTATQYALLSSLSTVGRTMVAATGGAIIEMVGWFNFFVFTTLAAAPGILLLWIVSKYFTKPVDSARVTG